MDLAPLAARTATGAGNAIDTDMHGISGDLRLELECTAAAGTTPTLNVGRQALSVLDPVATFVRASWTIAGTIPSFTFDVKLVTEKQ